MKSLRDEKTIAVPGRAATVALVRESEGGFQVLMMQRNFKSTFVPGSFVFPGGSLDAEDGRAGILGLCSGMSDEQANVRLSISRDGLAYWVAAIRELFEEAGVLLAYDGRRQLVTLEDAHTMERFLQHRKNLNQGASGMAEILRAENMSYAVDQLVYFAHWTTPLSEPIRYDARFFIGMAPPRQIPVSDYSETISHIWIRPAEAVDRYRNNDFKMRFPTVHTLKEFAEYSSAAELVAAMRAKDKIPDILPRHNKQGAVLLPQDAGYDEAI